MFRLLQLFSFQPSSSSSHPLYLPAPPPSPPVLSVPLFRSSSANKLCMLSPTHGVLHCCTICSKLLLALSLSLFPISHPLSFSLLICLSHALTCSVTNSTQPPFYTTILSQLVGPALLSQSSLQLNSTPEASLQYSASYHSNQTLALSDSISAATPQRSGQVGGAVHSYNQVGNTSEQREY